MRILVAYASRHGATQGIAARIADVLRRAGHEVDLHEAGAAKEVAGYDAFVIGSAAYMGRWLGETTGFVRRHSNLLADRPVWLFSSGPIGPDKVDKNGRDVLETTAPREFGEFESTIRPRGRQVFFGAYDPEATPIGLAERFMALTPARRALPAGDYRDWPAIEGWAESIALDLPAPRHAPGVAADFTPETAAAR